jgi:hypothetical protein
MKQQLQLQQMQAPEPGLKGQPGHCTADDDEVANALEQHCGVFSNEGTFVLQTLP